MATGKKTEFVGLRLTALEAGMLSELAEADGRYQSDVLRLLIRAAHAKRFGQPKPLKRKR